MRCLALATLLILLAAACGGSSETAIPASTTTVAPATTVPETTTVAPATTAVPTTTAPTTTAPTTTAPTTTAAATTTAAPTTTIAPTTTAAPTSTPTPTTSGAAEVEVGDRYEKDLQRFNEVKALMLASGDFTPYECTASIVGADRAMGFMTVDPTAEELALLGSCLVDFVPQINQVAPATTIAHGPSTTTTAAPTPCVDRPLTALPVSVENLAATTPLGHINVPEHTIPTDHVYLLLPGYLDRVAPSVALSSPGDLTLYRVTRTRYYVVGDTERYADWGLVFEVCEGRDLRFGHVTTVVDQIVEATDQATRRCNTYGYHAGQFEYCSFELYDAWEGLDARVVFSTGDPVGSLGGTHTPNLQLDLWAYDYNLPPLPFINMGRQPSDAQHAGCAFDWFAEDVRLLLYSLRQEVKLGVSQPADAAIGCGTIAQDIPGTAKGIWYTVQEVEGAWMDNLALVDDNTRSDHQLIAVASTLTDASDWIFEKKNDGRINLDFAKVEAGTGIYCYHEFAPDSQISTPGETSRLLIDVSVSEILTIELQSGSCGSNHSFNSPTEYQR